VAAWQADFHVALAADGLPPDYRTRLAEVLPVGVAWRGGPETWGTEEGDRVDVSTFGSSQEVFARFDMRVWRPDLYDRFLAFVRGIGGRLTIAEGGIEVLLTSEDFARALRGSRAARFVRDPEAYLRDLKVNPILMPEEP
jgi:hypothetical protein